MSDETDDNLIHLPSAVHVAAPEAAQALERMRQRRLHELKGWKPSGGWLTDAPVVAKPRDQSERLGLRSHLRYG